MNQRRFFCLRGFMKSGTNWVGQLLNSHPEIDCVGEFHWQNLVRNFNDNLNSLHLFQSESLCEKTRDHFETMIKHSMIEAADPSASLIGDRTPHTILPISLRNVPYISVIRDGRDVLVSRVFHLYNKPGVTGLFERIPEMAESFAEFQKDPWFFKKNPDRLLCHESMVRDSIAWWRDHLESDSETQKRFPKLKILFVNYEHIHKDPIVERSRLFEFLDVDPSQAAALDGLLKPGTGRERPTAFFRKGIVGDWQNYFTDQTKAWFKEEAGQTLIDYGYEDSFDW